MGISVVDENVWIMMQVSHNEDRIMVQCIEACVNWGEDMLFSTDQIVLDYTMRMSTNYFSKISPSGLAYIILTRLLTAPFERIQFISISFDEHGHAVIPSGMDVPDEDDRIYVAAALAVTPHAPILNATDTDWSQCRASLARFDVEVRELCSDYITSKAKT